MKRGPLFLVASGLAILVLMTMSLPLACSARADEAQTLELIPGGDAPSVKVLTNEEQGVVLEFELPQLAYEEVVIEGETYQILEIPGGSHAGAIGAPMLPTFARLVQIPAEAGVTCEIIGVTTTEWNGLRPLPMQPEGGEGFVVDPEAYTRSGEIDRPYAELGAPAIARDLRVVPLTFHPVRYDAAEERLEVARRIQVQVRYEGIDARNSKTRNHRVIPASFDQLYRTLVVNYQGPRVDQIVALGSYVIICPDDSEVVDALQPLVEWRTRKGYEVHLATTAETGASRQEIQDWIQEAYDTWPNPPEYIALIGDGGGAITLPYFTYGSYNGESDHPYVQLEGGDLLADAHIGRISVDSIDRLKLYVYKIVSYESEPYMAETDWYTRACLVGDPSISGQTCVQIMQLIKERLLDVGYTEVDTIFAAPFVSGMTTKFNRGDTVICYRGWLGMSSFAVGDILALQNGPKMAYAVISTCGTGSWAGGTARSEAFMRAGLWGDPPIPTGGIASVGTATTGTHTRYNNCLTYGIWRGVFWEDLHEFGASLTRGKYELYVNYGVADPSGAATFTHWNNLMGDPAGEMWTDVPQDLYVSHDPQIAVGANAFVVSVTDDQGPCEGAYVCLWMDGATHVGAATGADGLVDLPIDASVAGDMLLTVTKHNYLPHLATIPVADFTLFVGYANHAIDDDASGTSSGNGDGHPNPGETLELPVQVTNFGSATATSVTGVINCDDPYVTILDATEDFGTLTGGVSAWSVDDFDIAIDTGAPSGHILRLGLELTAGSDAWHSLIEIPVTAAGFAFDDLTLYDFGTQIDPGESGSISVSLANVGDGSGTNITGILSTSSPWITVTDEVGSWSTIPVGGTGENTVDRFGLSAAPACFQGHLAAMRAVLTFSGGAVDTVDFTLTVGATSTADPTGPDHYGYYAFDNTDIGYAQVPIYNWIEVDPNYGGQGTSVGLSTDDSRTVDLPFVFLYYGKAFTQATICTNGWMAMGLTPLVNYRNWHIPGAGAPENLIAPMWDHILPSGSNTVYHWFDAANHRYIVQWSRMRNAEGNVTENFELILYDPAYHPTETGDGIIEFQFDTFNNSDWEQHYSTTGIENEDRSDGLMYQYFNRYNAGAATIGSGRAIRFLPLASSPRGTLTGTVANVTAGGTGLAGAQVKVIDTGETLISGPDGFYGGAIGTGSHTVIASHASFEPDTAFHVVILEGEPTELDFSLYDNLAPQYSGTTDYGNTSNTAGPYEIATTVSEVSGLASIELTYNANGAGWVSVPMTHQGDNLYAADIPGQPYTSIVNYYVRGEDVGANISTDPANAPAETYVFLVAPPIFEDDMEAGPGNWTHAVVSSGYEDQWHRSDQRNHTSLGAWSWKFGDESSANYVDMADGGLVSEAFAVDEGGALISFWQWMEAEESSSYPGQAYDGGFVELSINGGPFEQVMPIGGYTHIVREGSGPGPYPAGTPIFSGSYGWTETKIELEDAADAVQIRFRFGSDGSINHEGWYIDDLMVTRAGIPFSGAEDELTSMPVRVALYQNVPNPIGSAGMGTRIRFDLPTRSEAVRLRIYDVGGRTVRTLIDGPMAAGSHAVLWDGRDARAHLAGSGVYYYVLNAHGERLAKQMLILR